MKFEKYIIKIKTPEIADFKISYFIDKGVLVATLRKNVLVYTSEQMEADYFNLALASKQDTVDTEKYKAAMRDYRKAKQELNDEFYSDLKVELDIVGNPKADTLISKAWDLGHSAGHREVYIWAKDLVELIK